MISLHICKSQKSADRNPSNLNASCFGLLVRDGHENLHRPILWQAPAPPWLEEDGGHGHPRPPSHPPPHLPPHPCLGLLQNRWSLFNKPWFRQMPYILTPLVGDMQACWGWMKTSQWRAVTGRPFKDSTLPLPGRCWSSPCFAIILIKSPPNRVMAMVVSGGWLKVEGTIAPRSIHIIAIYLSKATKNWRVPCSLKKYRNSSNLPFFSSSLNYFAIQRLSSCSGHRTSQVIWLAVFLITDTIENIMTWSWSWTWSIEGLHIFQLLLGQVDLFLVHPWCCCHQGWGTWYTHLRRHSQVTFSWD